MYHADLDAIEQPRLVISNSNLTEAFDSIGSSTEKSSPDLTMTSFNDSVIQTSLNLMNLASNSIKEVYHLILLTDMLLITRREL